MHISMYNTWFGDCFELKNDTQKLFVDFGIHKDSPIHCPNIAGVTRTREVAHNEISLEIQKAKGADFLLTHYHEDHFSGLLYMYNNSAVFSSPIFNTVYIPDVWNTPNSTTTVSLLLLEELLKNSRISGHPGTPNLMELIKYLCGGAKNLILTKRGTPIAFNNSIALWPDPEKINHTAQRYYERLLERPHLREILSELTPIAIELRERVLWMVSSEEYARTEQTTNAFLSIESRLSSLSERFRFVLTDQSYTEDCIRLNKFGNTISIVFHNKENSQNNYLFTGDITKGHLNRISKNYDGKHPLHSHYKYIKIPHHGTDNHYFDFSVLHPEIIMIPNGECCNDSYKISRKYCTSCSPTGLPRVYCSNCNWCAANPGRQYATGTCILRQLVFPKISILVI